MRAMLGLFPDTPPVAALAVGGAPPSPDCFWIMNPVSTTPSFRCRQG
jgi:hypothetical protein